jgi:hypothetical protein
VVEYLPSTLETQHTKENKRNRVYWLISVRLATWEAKIRSILDRATLDKKFMKSRLQNNKAKMELDVWFIAIRPHSVTLFFFIH